MCSGVASKQLDICNSFLRLRYHNDGEFLPDKFHFDGMEQPAGYVIGDPNPSNTQQVAKDLSSEDETSSAIKEGPDKVAVRNLEEDERAISALSIAAVTHNEPFHNAHVGPGGDPGPRKYLGVVKPAILYESMVIWANDSNYMPIPSFSTFRRALRAARPWLRFRPFETSNHMRTISYEFFFWWLTVSEIWIHGTALCYVKARKGGRPAWSLRPLRMV